MNTRQCTKPSGVLEGVPKALFWKQLEVQLERSVHMHAHTHTHTHPIVINLEQVFRKSKVCDIMKGVAS